LWFDLSLKLMLVSVSFKLLIIVVLIIQVITMEQSLKVKGSNKILNKHYNSLLLVIVD
jgi:hypothetical protein